MHDSILPHLAQPSLMIDFLTRAYDIGEQGTLLRGGPGRPATCVLGAPELGVQVGWASTAVCLSAGGAVSLLALNGLFILIHKHNL